MLPVTVTYLFTDFRHRYPCFTQQIFRFLHTDPCQIFGKAFSCLLLKQCTEIGNTETGILTDFLQCDIVCKIFMYILLGKTDRSGRFPLPLRSCLFKKCLLQLQKFLKKFLHCSTVPAFFLEDFRLCSLDSENIKSSCCKYHLLDFPPTYIINRKNRLLQSLCSLLRFF